jgi:hypothetical protein
MFFKIGLSSIVLALGLSSTVHATTLTFVDTSETSPFSSMETSQLQAILSCNSARS